MSLRDVDVRPVSDVSPVGPVRSVSSARPAGRVAAKPALELVEPDAWRVRRRVRALTALGVVVLVLAPFAIVALHVLMAQQQFELDELQTQQVDAERRYSDLRDEVATASSGPRIVALAQHYGWVLPDDETQVTVPASSAPSTGAGATVGTAGSYQATKRVTDAP